MELNTKPLAVNQLPCILRGAVRIFLFRGNTALLGSASSSLGARGAAQWEGTVPHSRSASLWVRGDWAAREATLGCANARLSSELLSGPALLPQATRTKNSLQFPLVLEGSCVLVVPVPEQQCIRYCRQDGTRRLSRSKRSWQNLPTFWGTHPRRRDIPVRMHDSRVWLEIFLFFFFEQAPLWFRPLRTLLIALAGRPPE